MLTNDSLTLVQTQFIWSSDMMESYCRLGFDNTVRLCSAVFDVLNETGNEEQRYYVKKVHRICAFKDVKKNESRVVRAKVVQCTILRENGNSIAREFFLLADPGDRSAVFVLFQQRKGRLEMSTRVTKIGALLNPISSEPRESDATEADVSQTGIESDDEGKEERRLRRVKRQGDPSTEKDKRAIKISWVIRKKRSRRNSESN